MTRAHLRPHASATLRPRLFATAALVGLAGTIGVMGGFMPLEQATDAPRSTAPATGSTPGGKPAAASGTKPGAPSGAAAGTTNSGATSDSRGPRTARRAPQGNGEGRAPARQATRELDATRVDALIEVAQDVSPAWAEWLRERRASDPESLRTAIAQNGRRLIALSVLREQSPDLYRMKVAEMRLQAETGDAAKRHREAVEAGRTAEADQLAQELREKARAQVDLDLKTRAAELAALDQQVRALKEQLTRDTKGRTQRIDTLVDALTAGKVGDPMAPPPKAAAPKTNEGDAGGSAGGASNDTRPDATPSRPAEPAR